MQIKQIAYIRSDFVEKFGIPRQSNLADTRAEIHFLPEYQNLDELKAHYQRGGLGDMKVKRFLNNVLQTELEPIRNRRKELQKDIPAIYEILKKGSEKAEAVAAQTLKEVKDANEDQLF